MLYPIEVTVLQKNGPQKIRQRLTIDVEQILSIEEVAEENELYTDGINCTIGVGFGRLPVTDKYSDVIEKFHEALEFIRRDKF